MTSCQFKSTLATQDLNDSKYLMGHIAGHFNFNYSELTNWFQYYQSYLDRLPEIEIRLGSNFKTLIGQLFDCLKEYDDDNTEKIVQHLFNWRQFFCGKFNSYLIPQLEWKSWVNRPDLPKVQFNPSVSPEEYISAIIYYQIEQFRLNLLGSIYTILLADIYFNQFELIPVGQLENFKLISPKEWKIVKPNQIIYTTSLNQYITQFQKFYNLTIGIFQPVNFELRDFNLFFPDSDSENENIKTA